MNETTSNNKQELAKTEKMGNNLLPQTLNVANLDELMTVLTHLAKSANNGVSTPEEAFSLFVRSRELGIGLGAALEHMNVINGKTGADVHIVKAVLLKAGTIEWKKIEDFVPLHEYVDNKGRKRLHLDIVEEHGEDWTITSNANQVELAKKNNIPYYALTLQNWKTTYEFTRYRTLANGREITQTVTSSFTWTDAIAAQLPFNSQGQLDPKGNWQKYRHIMLDHRAFTFGARDIGADYLLGVYTNEELFSMNNIDYDVSPEGNVTIQDKDGSEVKFQQDVAKATIKEKS